LQVSPRLALRDGPKKMFHWFVGSIADAPGVPIQVRSTPLTPYVDLFEGGQGLMKRLR